MAELLEKYTAILLYNHLNSAKMFEATLAEGAVLKKIIESIKDIVTDVNIDISPSGMFSI